jgi:hypothetical protein
VALTGLSKEEFLKQNEDNLIDAHLSKPLKLELLSGIIQELSDKKALL